jgi:hypothetical protein
MRSERDNSCRDIPEPLQLTAASERVRWNLFDHLPIHVQAFNIRVAATVPGLGLNLFHHPFLVLMGKFTGSAFAGKFSHPLGFDEGIRFTLF